MADDLTQMRFDALRDLIGRYVGTISNLVDVVAEVAKDVEEPEKQKLFDALTMTKAQMDAANDQMDMALTDLGYLPRRPNRL